MMRSYLSPLAFLLILCVSSSAAQTRPPFACDPRDATTKNMLFCRKSLPAADRVKDLLGRLTLKEKVGMLVDNAAAVPRLGIKGYEWWSEALHGVSNVGPGTKFGGAFPGATSFPQVITTAASFNESLWEQIGRVRFSSSYIINHLSYTSLLGFSFFFFSAFSVCLKTAFFEVCREQFLVY